MNFIDLAAQQQRIRESLDEAIGRVLNHGQYVMGPEIRELEEKLAAYAGVRHAVSCASGTDALLMALMAYGIGPGDAVFTTPFTFVATAEVISLLGATPVFVDIEPDTYNIDPGQLEKAIVALQSVAPGLHPLPKNDHGSGRSNHPLLPKGVIAVDLFGLPANYEEINAVARRHGLFVIEDAAQSFGAEYQGRKACSLADIGCTSFFPAKPLGCYGDGGMCFTDDDETAQVLRSIRIHGQGSDKYENVRIGINGRLDTLQAAILLAKFSIFPEEVELRQAVAARYKELLPLPAASMNSKDAAMQGEADILHSENWPLKPPLVPEGCKSVWAQYSLLAGAEGVRAICQEELKKANIPTAIYYPLPLHLQRAYAPLAYRPGDFPVSETVARRIFSIPMHPYLDNQSQEEIGRVLKQVTGAGL